MEKQADREISAKGSRENRGRQDLPVEAERFWSAGEPLEAFPPPPTAEGRSALERLGPSRFPKGKFPFLGLLATIYEHIATHARARK
jgi:hypothetical protein